MKTGHLKLFSQKSEDVKSMQKTYITYGTPWREIIYRLQRSQKENTYRNGQKAQWKKWLKTFQILGEIGTSRFMRSKVLKQIQPKENSTKILVIKLSKIKNRGNFENTWEVLITHKGRYIWWLQLCQKKPCWQMRWMK